MNCDQTRQPFTTENLDRLILRGRIRQAMIGLCVALQSYKGDCSNWVDSADKALCGMASVMASTFTEGGEV
jgi:hypothetical protein